MVTREEMIAIIKKILEEYSKIQLSHGEAEHQVIIDENQDIYQLKLIGWDGPRHIYGTVFDLQIKDNKIWVHYDATEDGVVTDLENFNIPKDQIVLGFMPKYKRKYTDYAVE